MRKQRRRVIKGRVFNTWVLLILAVFMLISTVSVGAYADTLKCYKKSTLYVFDLKAFLGKFGESKVAYDYMKLATAFQGLVNRNKPNVFFYYESKAPANMERINIDRYWMDKLKLNKSFSRKYELVEENDFFRLLKRFQFQIKGIVLWDETVPATANVASTIAGVENLLPVRFDEAQSSLYNDIVVKNKLFKVQTSLVGKFTGKGIIPDIRKPSTGSAKNDAYLWTKKKYLDKGLTNRTMMCYALDAVSWGDIQDKGLRAQVISAYVPSKLQVNTTGTVSVTVKNTGTQSWQKSSLDRLGALNYNSLIWSDLNGGYSKGVTDQRVFLDANEVIDPGQTKTFQFSITAPSEEGTYTFSAGMVRDGVTWMRPGITSSVEVTAGAVRSQTMAEKPFQESEFSYPDLYNSSLPNADYYIANKAFFFDLSPDQNSVPNDDKPQPVGTDYNTLTELLRSQNRQAGNHIITIGGFVPWWLKYTTHIDENATFSPVEAEWKFVEIASRYNAQIDADAYGLIGMSNTSLYQHVPLKQRYVQKNRKDKAGEAFDRSKKYLTIYMGDFDSASWTSGILPLMWDDPERGKLPLGWSFAPMVSQRAPQVFNYIYHTMTPNDYFVAGDNGAGYLNPMMLMKENRPDGLKEFLNVWERYNKEYYRRFDLDISGFIISGFSEKLPERIQQLYSRVSQVGVGTNGAVDKRVVRGTPFFTVKGTGVSSSSDYVALANGLIHQLENNQFSNIRIVLVKPSVICQAVDYIREVRPDLNFEVVDPYTFYRFYKKYYKEDGEEPPHEIIDYPASRTVQSIHVDGIIEEGEWENANEIPVNNTSQEVIKYGRLWGSQTDDSDLTSRYRIQWDEDYLYLLEQRQDDSLQFTEAGANLYLSDATMLFLDIDRNKSGTAYRDGDYAVMMSPGSPNEGGPVMILREGHDSGQVEKVLKGGILASQIQQQQRRLQIQR